MITPKFAPNTLGLTILAKNKKYVNFAGVAFMGVKPVWRIEFTNKKHLECTSNHRLIGPNGIYTIDELQVGDRVFRHDGRFTRVKAKFDTGREEPVYDIIEADEGHKFIANGVESSNCAFVTDDETLIDSLLLSSIVFEEPAFYTKTVRWFREPQANHTYLVALDPGLGTGRDFAAIQVYSLPGMEQVAEWMHNKTPVKGQMAVLRAILLEIDNDLRNNPDQHGDPDIYWTVENNTLGEANLVVLEHTGEDRFPGTMVHEKRRKGVARGRVRKGLNTNSRTKIAACVRAKSLIETGRMQVRSRALLKQLKNFIRKETSYSAKSGEHDDLVMAMLLCVRMLDSGSAQGLDLSDYMNEGIEDEDFEDSEQDGAMPMTV